MSYMVQRISAFLKLRPSQIYLIFSIGAASLSSVYYRWVSDDAFISFRYAKNLIDGLGLVYNRGEAVEGYTNFLWTMLLSAGMYLGYDPLRISQALGILFYLSTVYILYRVSLRLFPRPESGWPAFRILPLASLCLAVQTHAAIFATGGLETSLFGFLLALGSSFLLITKKWESLMIGLSALMLSAFTRPDGLLFYAFGSAYVFLFHFQKDKIVEKIIKFIFMQIPFLVFYLPYWIWKWDYYGYIFPNTYYAKSADSWYISQGIQYILLYFSAYYVFLFIPGILIYVWISKYYPVISGLKKSDPLKERKLKKEITERTGITSTVFLDLYDWRNDFLVRSSFLLLLPSVLYIFFLMKIGGDFMFARLLIPLSPLLFIYLEILVHRGIEEKGRAFIYIFIIFSLLFSWNHYRGTKYPSIQGITQENEIYRLKTVYQIKNFLLPYRETFSAANMKIAFGGSQALFAFYLNPSLAVESATGLTDQWIAHRKISARGRVGHEKEAPIEYLRQRKVHLDIFGLKETPKRDYSKFQIPRFPYPFWIVCYDRELFRFLKKTGKFHFQDFEEYLDVYIADIKNKSRTQIRKDYAEFQEYYFSFNSDPERENAFLRASK